MFAEMISYGLLIQVFVLTVARMFVSKPNKVTEISLRHFKSAKADGDSSKISFDS
jgi:hypothetical protein